MQSIFRGLPSAPSQQRGMATILIIMLMGLALTVTALGVMYSVRTSQEQQVTVHAATHSQAGVWTAAEAVGLYLKELDKTALMAFNPEKPLKFKINDNNVVAKIFPLDVDTAPHHLRAEISYTDTAAKATSTLEVVYNITLSTGNPPPPPPPPPPDGGQDALTFSKNLNMSGSITVLGGDAAIFNVDGDVNLGNASITGIKTINASGNITIGSGIKVDNLYANGDITLTGSASVLTAASLKDITINSGASQGILNANGNITIKNGSVTTADALGFIKASSGGAHGAFTAGKTIEISNGSLSSANAVGNIDINGSLQLTTARSEGTITCPSPYWSNFSSIQAEIATKNCMGENVSAPIPVSIETMEPLTPLTLARPTVDAYQLQDAANYVFSYSSGIQVKVKNINAISDGIYRVGKIKKDYNNKWGYLCSVLDSNDFCKTECATITSGACTGAGIEKLHKICQGTWDGEECIKYVSNGKKWILTGQSGQTVFAPGILWFAGDLSLPLGFYRNSIIASGSITSSGSTKVSAVNYNGYQETCQNTTFPNIHPTNLCGTTRLHSNSISNIALLAGGYVGTTFEGGTIDLGGSTEIFGSVIAGDAPITDGNTIIHGYVTAAGQGSSVVSPFKGSTTIDLRNLPSGYNPGEIPDMGTTPGGGGSGDDDGETIIKILWSRYL